MMSWNSAKRAAMPTLEIASSVEGPVPLLERSAVSKPDYAYPSN